MKQLTGIVTSTKMTNSAVVKVDWMWQHPIYKKRVKRSKKFLIHTEKPLITGQTVTFQETRPLSKRKRWVVVDNNKTAKTSELKKTKQVRK